MEQQNEVEKRTLFSKIKSYFLKSKRVFKITKKPTKEEFKITVKVTSIGIAIIGFLGFIIHFIWNLLG